MSGDGVEAAEQIGKPLSRTIRWAKSNWVASFVRASEGEIPHPNLDFTRAQVIAGVGKQSRDFEPSALNSMQMRLPVPSLEKISWSEF